MTDIEIPLGKRTRFYRFFEILPGVLSYSMIFAPIFLSLINPVIGALFVIIFIIIWFVKAIGMTVRIVQGYNVLQSSLRVDWAVRLSDLQDPEKALKNFHPRKAFGLQTHRYNLENMSHLVNAKKPSDIFNAVIIPTYNEGRDILEPTIKAVMSGSYDSRRIILVIAYEERGGKEIEETCRALQKKFKTHFKAMYIVKHPANLKNEVVGKGGNATYAGKFLAKQLDNLSLNPENIIVTTLDADNRPHTSYFSYVTYEFLVHPEPRHVAFQPLALFLNNIWDVPAPMRVLATGNSFWNLISSLRPHMLRNFAAHSQSMAALIDMDFWSVRTIVEDGHQFWRSYFRYDGQYHVVPLYIPIYQDAVLADTYKKTLKAQFSQLRRWAYGVSDIPYVAERVFTRHRTVPLVDGIQKFLRLLDSHVSWASASVILMFGAFAPLFVSPEASRSIVAYQLPGIASGLQTIAMVAIFVQIFLTFKLLPPRPARYKSHRNLGMLFQWLLMPITSIAYGSVAAINAQTRLLLGKYLDKFEVTDKSVIKD